MQLQRQIDILDWFCGILEDWLGHIEPNQKSQIVNWVKSDLIWVNIKLINLTEVITIILDDAKAEKIKIIDI